MCDYTALPVGGKGVEKWGRVCFSILQEVEKAAAKREGGEKRERKRVMRAMQSLMKVNNPLESTSAPHGNLISIIKHIPINISLFKWRNLFAISWLLTYVIVCLILVYTVCDKACTYRVEQPFLKYGSLLSGSQTCY